VQELSTYVRRHPPERRQSPAVCCPVSPGVVGIDRNDRMFARCPQQPFSGDRDLVESRCADAVVGCAPVTTMRMQVLLRNSRQISRERFSLDLQLAHDGRPACGWDLVAHRGHVPTNVPDPSFCRILLAQGRENKSLRATRRPFLIPPCCSLSVSDTGPAYPGHTSSRRRPQSDALSEDASTVGKMQAG